jgi:hypothetical protein
MREKEIEIGMIKYPYEHYAHRATIEITLQKKSKGLVLSICGNVWNHIHTDLIQCGQIQDTFKEALNHYEMLSAGDHPTFTKLFVNYKKLRQLLTIWDKWNLNDLNAGCIHQRIAKWDEVKLDDTKPLTQDNMATWTTPDKNPKGLLTVPCTICGYKYGTAWLLEELPQDIIQFVKEFAGNLLNTTD